MSPGSRQLALAAGTSLSLLGAVALSVAASPDAPFANGSSAPPAPRAYSAVQVRAAEFSLVLSRSELSAGRVRVELYNAGEDAHDLLLLGEDGGGPAYQWPVTDPRAAYAITVRLERGRWGLICTLPEHAERGMQASLRVRRRARRPEGRNFFPRALSSVWERRWESGDRSALIELGVDADD